MKAACKSCEIFQRRKAEFIQLLLLWVLQWRGVDQVSKLSKEEKLVSMLFNDNTAKLIQNHSKSKTPTQPSLPLRKVS
jgi:hypothetical protein